MSNIIWIILIGFVAGLIARMLSPGPNDPKGFILTTVLGIAGAFYRNVHRPDCRLVSARPGRRSHRRDDRSAGRSICLEPVGRPPHH